MSNTGCRAQSDAGAQTRQLTCTNSETDPPQDRMPAIWLIHDEFAEWMLTEEYKEAVSSVVQRLGVKARAAGIYLVFAAQRPDANVMPMQLRANLGNRLILRVLTPREPPKLRLAKEAQNAYLGEVTCWQNSKANANCTLRRFRLWILSLLRLSWPQLRAEEGRHD